MSIDTSPEPETELHKADGKSLFYSIVIPLIFVVILWLVKLIEVGYGVSFAHFGLLPRTLQGLAGIFTAPLIHSDFGHLFSNTVPLAALGVIMFIFYREIAFNVFWWIYFMTGLWVWAAGREVYHIGASGIVYGMVCFVFFSGIFRWDKRLMRPSLIVLVFYGGLIWGIFPGQQEISWESHALGSLAGIMTAFYFRKDGPQKKKYEWEDEEDEIDPVQLTVDPASMELNPNEDRQNNVIRYIYIQRKSSGDNTSNPGRTT
jgi:membrane associated rhomboid family serine protease